MATATTGSIHITARANDRRLAAEAKDKEKEDGAPAQASRLSFSTALDGFGHLAI